MFRKGGGYPSGGQMKKQGNYRNPTAEELRQNQFYDDLADGVVCLLAVAVVTGWCLVLQ
jgi:hypothetical protein